MSQKQPYKRRNLYLHWKKSIVLFRLALIVFFAHLMRTYRRLCTINSYPEMKKSVINDCLIDHKVGFLEKIKDVGAKFMLEKHMI